MPVKITTIGKNRVEAIKFVEAETMDGSKVMVLDPSTKGQFSVAVVGAQREKLLGRQAQIEAATAEIELAKVQAELDAQKAKVETDLADLAEIGQAVEASLKAAPTPA